MKILCLKGGIAQLKLVKVKNRWYCCVVNKYQQYVYLCVNQRLKLDQVNLHVWFRQNTVSMGHAGHLVKFKNPGLQYSLIYQSVIGIEEY